MNFFDLSNNLHYYLLNRKFTNMYGNFFLKIDVDIIFNTLTM